MHRVRRQAIAGHLSKGFRLTEAHSALQSSTDARPDLMELREQLLDELNQRFKSNLQILHGLLHGAYSKTDNSETREILADTSRRIAAMGTAQKIFYSAGNLTDISGQKLLKGICVNAAASFGKEVSINCEATTASLPKETVMPLALILNELLTNAAKHGADDRGRVTIDAGLSQRSGSHELYVQDQGAGFGFEEAVRRSSGLGLVRILAQQLRGTFTVERRSGARCTLSFSDQ